MKPQRGQIRIIGGTWRSRKLPLAPHTDVRPTPDRIRETLFNWLQNDIHGASCLDLYAGSGALSFEALSRGAGSVTMVDEDLRVVQQLTGNIAMLKSEDANVEWNDAEDFLGQTRKTFDIVFLDPPYRQDCLSRLCKTLHKNRLLNPHAIIYVESPSKRPLSDIPGSWQIKHSKTSGEVGYHLIHT